MVEEGRDEEEMSGMKHMDAEEMRNHRFDGRRRPCAPQNNGSIIRTGSGRGHTCFQDCHEKSVVMEDEGRNIEVGVGNRSLRVGYQYQVTADVWRPVVTPHNDAVSPGGVITHASGTQARSVAEP